MKKSRQSTLLKLSHVHFLSFVVLTISSFSAAAQIYPVGDLNQDYIVDIGDLEIFAGQWLDAPGCVPPYCAELDGIGRITLSDFSLLAASWLDDFGLPLVINELMASTNSASGISDPQGEFDDWIEIHNYGDTSIDIGEMYLTDDLSNPKAWQIPANRPAETTIDPNSFIIIWADGDVADTPGLHAGFELSSGGEEIGLFEADGTTLTDSVTFGDQVTNITYGRWPDGDDDLRYFATATPGSANNDAYLGLVEDTQFNYNRGFYDAPFDLIITCATPDADIYYTTDGSDPIENEMPSSTSITYTGPISVSSTSCIRAAAMKTGWRPTNIDTHTYIFVNDVLTQSPDGQAPGPGWPTGSVNGQEINYGMDPDIVENDARYSDVVDDALLDIPSISLVTDLDHLFDPSTGIYVNAYNDGIDWERPASVELIHPDGSDGFQINAGLRIRGGYSRSGANPKHAFRLFFRSDYGDSKLKYPLFEDEGVDEFEKVDLRTAQNYSWSFGRWEGYNNTMAREVFNRNLQREMGQPYTRSRYYHLYINGQYWGIYQTQERAEARYAKSYFGGEVDDYDVIKGAWTSIEVTDGNSTAYNNFWAVANSGFRSNSTYYRAQGLNPDGTVNPDYPKYLDADNLIDYMIGVYYSGDFDAPISNFGGNNTINNFYAVYNRNNPDGWKFFRHDGEHSLLAHDTNFPQSIDRTGPYDAGNSMNLFNPQWLHQQLVENQEYLVRFADRVHKYFANGGILTPTNASNLFMARAHVIDTAIIAESARWGDSKVSQPRTKDDDWLPAINNLINNFFPVRTDTVLAQFRNKGWYPTIDPPVYAINGSYQHGGYISKSDYVTMTNPNGSGVIYYTLDGADPRVSAADSQTSSGLILVTESASKKIFVPTEPLTGGTGSISVEYWMGISGTSVSNLTNHANYPDNPGSAGSLTSFEIPTNWADNYGTRVRGYVIPPASGDYTFWIASDDNGELWLSSDEDPANASRIAYVSDWTNSREWTKYASQESDTISLTAGQSYYIEALQKEGSGGDNLAVSWDGPGFNRKVIEGSSLSPFVVRWAAIDFDDTAWTSGAGGVGYENNPGDPVNYTSLIDTDVKTAMYNVNPTCYIRIPFTVNAADLAGLTDLTLNIRYDDGFIAYLNGVKIAEEYADSTPAWDSTASGQRDDSICVNTSSFNLSGHIGDLTSGTNVLAIHGMNQEANSSDFLITAELAATSSEAGSVAPTAIEYTGGMNLAQSTNLKSRILSGTGQWSALNETVYGIGPVAESLRISELMYHPADPNDEFIELINTGAESINLNLVRFTKGVDFTFGSESLAPDERILLVRNQASFMERYPAFGGRIAGEFEGKLDDAGEEIRLRDALDTVIQEFTYNDGWYDITDGVGFSLTICDASATDPNLWDYKEGWRPSAVGGGSPGYDDAGILPDPGSVVINEVLAHSHAAAPDWIELHNTTVQTINIGGWFLSDSNADDPNVMKYEIPLGSSIPGNGYIVFNENDHFGNPAANKPFALSEGGDTVYLRSGSNGVPGGYEASESFGASASGVSFGRFIKSPLDGGVNFVAMSDNTPGEENTYPEVGPVVISEIMYNTEVLNTGGEYIELHNITADPVTLQDSVSTETSPGVSQTDVIVWQFSDGIDFVIPANTTIPPHGYLIIAGDPTAFSNYYGAMPSGVAVLGPFQNETALSNGGEQIQIVRPGDQEYGQARFWIRTERVTYDDAAPWPVSADGDGDSLHQKTPDMTGANYGNDVVNWEAAEPSPGQ